MEAEAAAEAAAAAARAEVEELRRAAEAAAAAAAADERRQRQEREAAEAEAEAVEAARAAREAAAAAAAEREAEGRAAAAREEAAARCRGGLQAGLAELLDARGRPDKRARTPETTSLLAPRPAAPPPPHVGFRCPPRAGLLLEVGEVLLHEEVIELETFTALSAADLASIGLPAAVVEALCCEPRATGPSLLLLRRASSVAVAAEEKARVLRRGSSAMTHLGVSWDDVSEHAEEEAAAAAAAAAPSPG